MSWQLVLLIVYIIVMTTIRLRYLFKIYRYLKKKHKKVYDKYTPTGSLSFLLFGGGGWRIGIAIMLTKKLYLDETITKMIKNFRLLALLHLILGVGLATFYLYSRFW